MRHSIPSLTLSALLVATASAVGPDGAAPGAATASFETQANIFEYNRQEAPSLAVDAHGRTLVAWGSRRQEAGSFGVYARLFDADGNAIGGEIGVNTHWPNNQEAPAVTFAPDGSAWIAWRSHGQDGEEGAIVARRFGVRDGRFTALTDEVLVNASTAGDQREAVVAALCDRALVAWTTTRADGRAQVTARLVTAGGTVLGHEFALDDAPGRQPAVTAQPGRRAFVAAWSRFDEDGRPCAIMGRSVAMGPGPVVCLSGDDERRHLEPALDTDAQGRVTAAWMATGDFGGYDVIVRGFDADLAPRTSEIRIDDSSPWRSGAAIACADDGRFIVSWNAQDRLGAGDVMMQRFDAGGTALAVAQRVNAHAEGMQALAIATGAARSAWHSGDRVVHAWNGRTPSDGSGIGVSWIGMPSAGAAPAALVLDPAVAARRLTPDEVAAAERLAPPDFDPTWVPEPRDPPTLGPGPDFGFLAFQNTGWNPPDPDLAVGPDHVVAVVNGGIAFFTKAGVMTFSDSIAGAGGFWGEVGATSFVFDPVAVYDTLIDRYIVAATEHADNGDDVIVLAVSDDDDPNGSWNKYRWDMSAVGAFIDFPNLGVDKDAIYITTDFFDPPEGNWIHIIDKNAVMNGLATTPDSIQTSGGFRSLGAMTSYDNDAPAAYFATSHTSSFSIIEIDAVTNPLVNPQRQTFSLTVPSYSNPPGAEQQGSTNLVSTVGRRIKHGVYRRGSLWLAHTTGEGGTARVRWYEVRMNGWPTSGSAPALLQSGTQDLGPGVHNWFADIHVDLAGNAAVAFNQSSASEFVSVQRTLRLAGDPAGTLRAPTLLQESTSPETSSRWGDYSGVEEDPAEPSVFWNHHEYRTSSWRTWIGRFDIFDGLADISFSYPAGKPDLLNPSGGTPLRVQLLEAAGAPLTGSARLHVDDGDGFIAIPMTHLGGELYQVEFPPVPCGAVVPWYVSAQSTAGGTFTDPEDAPASTFATPAYDAINVAFEDDFEADLGWTVSGNATDGQWDRGVPAGGGDRGDPPADADGSGQCLLTDNEDGNSDVDGGATTITSPVMDASGDPSVVYWRWYDNSFGDNPEEDTFVVEVSDDAGGTWTVLETVGPAGAEVQGGWFLKEFRVADFVTPNDQFRIRFTASDFGAGSVVEAGVDGVALRAFECGAPSCPGDLDGDGAVGFGDLLTLLAEWGPCPGCNGDLDGDDAVGFGDLLALLAAWGDCP